MSVGCQSPGIRLNAEQAKIRAQLQQIDPASDRLAWATPVIDVHTHTFNARYLPLRNILLGKRDAKPPLTWLLSDSCAEALAQAVIDRTELAPIGNQDGAKRVAGPQPHIRHGPVCNILLRLLDKAAMAGAWREDMPLEKQKRQLDEVADRMQPQERLMIRTAGAMMGMEKALETPDKKSGDRSLVRFLWMITQNDARMKELYRSDYSGAAMRGQPLIVSHMMDLPPVYAQDEDGATLLKFSDQQLKRMQAYQEQADSGLIYFVAYNPYRDHWPVLRSDGSLRVVQDAVRERGAWGVKFYPPSGYRPAANKIPSRPCGVRSYWPKIEYDARYAGLGANQSNRDTELNRRVDELLTWCIREDIPVFVHSGTGEFEAQKGYGLSNSNPSFWREFLESHPGKNAQGKEIPCPLRLCLGHAGGADFWFGEGKYPDWGREAYELCREFPNVYCEITTHAELTYPDKQVRFVENLTQLMRDRGPARQHKYPPTYKFSQKLIYGTDWYLPDAAERQCVLRATQQAFLHPRLRAFYQDYFFDNALRYLNAKARLNDPRHPLPPAVRERIQHALRLSQEKRKWKRWSSCPEVYADISALMAGSFLAYKII